MVSSLGRRIFLIYGLFFLSGVVLTNLFAWWVLKADLEREARFRLKLAAYDLRDILKEAQFHYQLALLRSGIHAQEIKLVAKREALKGIRERLEGAGLRYLVLENDKVIAGNTAELKIFFSPEIPVKERVDSSEFSWTVYLGVSRQDLEGYVRRVLLYYLLGLSVIVFSSLAVTYLAYRKWLRAPLSQVIRALETGDELHPCGIKEVDLLVSRIREALKREKEWMRSLALTEKMSALGVMAGGYAHEFNNLLQVVSGHLRLAQIWLENGKQEKVLERLKKAEEAALRGSEISARILRLARKESPREKRIVPLKEVVFHTLEALKKGFPKGITLEVWVEEGLYTPLSEEEWQEILMNLVLNAKDAVGEEGDIIVRGWREGDKVLLSVEDTGCGIPDEIKTRIFEPFFTTKEPGKGTGLGLFVVHQLVTGAGGKISVDSHPGQGACFLIELPVAEPPPSQTSEKSSVFLTPPSVTSHYRILVVDDEAEIRENLTELLRILGLEVEEASSAEEALEKLKRETYDLLLVDLLMPEKDGAWLVRELSRTISPPPVVFMTGFTGELAPEIQELLKTGLAQKVLRKPFRLEEIKNTLREVLSCHDSSS